MNVGVDIAKDQFYDWIAIERPGPGYCHFPAKPDEYNSEFFAQLTAEKRFKKWVRGAQVWAFTWVDRTTGDIDS